MQRKELEHLIQLALKSKKIAIGHRASLKNLERARLILISEDCPHEVRSKLRPGYVVYPGRAIELGALCGKPFPIACLAVLE